jgi:hypothetical protein
MQSLLVVMLVTSCKYDYDCEREEPLELSLRADLRCPSPREVEAEGHLREDSVASNTDRVEHGVWYDPRTICWYRIHGGDPSTPCLDDPTTIEGARSRTFYLNRALRSGHDDFSDFKTGWTAAESAQADDQRSETFFTSCDAESLLYGSVHITPVTTPAEALAVEPIECPPEVTPDPLWTRLAPDESVSGLVGSDFYPGRIMCAYDVTEDATCTSGGLGALPWG